MRPVNIAVATWLPTSLAVRVSPRAIRVLVPLFVGLVGLGVGSGVAAARSATRAPPGTVMDGITEWASATTAADPSGVLGRLRERVPPWVLDWRPPVPTVTTLTTFVLFVTLTALMTVGVTTAAFAAAVAAHHWRTGASARRWYASGPEPLRSGCNELVHHTTTIKRGLGPAAYAASPSVVSKTPASSRPFTHRPCNPNRRRA